MFNKALKSRTVWTIFAMFLIGGVSAVTQFIPPAFLPYIEGGLGLVATYFKLKPSQDYSENEV